MFPLRTTIGVVTLVLAGLLLAGCSTVKLAYGQAPQLLAWQLNRYLDLSQPQAERVRDELAELHRWHRDTLLPEHAGLLQKLRQQLPAPMSPEQACRAYADLRTQIDQLLARAEPSLVWLASDLSEAQIRSLQKRQADSNADWKKSGSTLPRTSCASTAISNCCRAPKTSTAACRSPRRPRCAATSPSRPSTRSAPTPNACAARRTWSRCCARWRRSVATPTRPARWCAATWPASTPPRTRPTSATPRRWWKKAAPVLRRCTPP